MINYTLRIGVVAAILLALSVTAIGCGDGGNGNGEAGGVDTTDSKVARCLEREGASFASTADNLKFFSDAEHEDAVSKSGFMADESAGLIVELYEDGLDPTEWFLWTGQPFGAEKSPLEIAAGSGSDGYVAYVVNPSKDQRRSLDACT
jgi:hypothetical protein